MVWVIRRTERVRKGGRTDRRDVIIAAAQKNVRAVVALAQSDTGIPQFIMFGLIFRAALWVTILWAFYEYAHNV